MTKKDKVVLKYMGQHGERWSCVPARDLTVGDLEAMATGKMPGHPEGDILAIARTVDGKPLYVRIEETEEVQNGDNT